MTAFRSKVVGLGTAVALIGAVFAFGASTAGAATRVTTIDGFKAPDTPEKYNKVRVVKYGSPDADKVLVLNPGTSAGGTFFGPFANALTKKMNGWQVWAIERRENLLEDHSFLEKYANGEITNKEVFDYYLGWLSDGTVTNHFTPKTTEETEFAKNWGMNVAVHDTRNVVKAAEKGGRTVVMGGHSLGGSITTAYATWDFNGKAGAKGLSGLVFIDGAGANGAARPLPTAEEAQTNVDNLNSPSASPFITLVQPFPWIAGVFNATGSTAAVEEPDEASTFGSWVLAPANLKPPVPATNAAQYGFAVDQTTSPSNLALVQSHIGRLAGGSADPRGWHDGELGSVHRAASVFSEYVGLKGQTVGEDGTSWYHPLKLSMDAGAINNGVDNPAQAVYGDHATMGDSVKLPMYSFDTSLGGGRVADATRQLAEQSNVPDSWVTTIKRTKSFSHIDPISAAPSKNAFLQTVIPFLRNKIK